jgi:hypothetical protein
LDYPRAQSARRGSVNVVASSCAIVPNFACLRIAFFISMEPASIVAVVAKSGTRPAFRGSRSFVGVDRRLELHFAEASGVSSADESRPDGRDVCLLLCETCWGDILNRPSDVPAHRTPNYFWESETMKLCLNSKPGRRVMLPFWASSFWASFLLSAGRPAATPVLRASSEPCWLLRSLRGRAPRRRRRLSRSCRPGARNLPRRPPCGRTACHRRK